MGFLRNTKSERLKDKVEACLADGACELILRSAMESPGITAENLDASVVNRLVDEGILVIEREEEMGRCYVTAEARALLIEHMPLHYQCPGLKRE